MDASLLGLPWQIQFGLAAGYAAYALAYIGIRSHHQTIDVAFRTLVFSAIATFVLTITVAGGGPIVSSALGLASALLAGFIWRGAGRDAVRWILEHTNYAAVDDDPTAFSRVYSDTKHDVTQVTVTLDDGSELWCDDTSAFAKAPITPFSIGEDGSVALYATRLWRRGTNGEEIEENFTTVRDADWGDRMTLVPADHVRRVELRFKRKPQGKRKP